MEHSPGFLAIVQETKSRIRETDVPTIRKRLEDPKRHFLLIDVREDHEWEKGHIPGALHLGRGILERDIEKKAPSRQTELVLYCGGGYRSALAADNLQRMGYQNVLSMDGGFRGWVDAGGPVER
jgi:rhodanese-related sulfurtransferase